jgi:cell wall-associated NlpC family hydrolase
MRRIGHDTFRGWSAKVPWRSDKARRSLGMQASVTPLGGLARAGKARRPAATLARAGGVGASLAAMAALTAAAWPVRAAAATAVIPGGPAAIGRFSGNTGLTGAGHGGRLAPDVIVVAPRGLPPAAVAAVQHLRGVAAAELADAAKVLVNGKYAQVLGVDPVSFRRFAAPPTASDTALWRNVARGQIAVSYTMGKQDRLPPGAAAEVRGRQPLRLRVAGLGTVGIAGVDAVVSEGVARALGFPAGNALVISAARHAKISRLRAGLARVVPKSAQVVILAAPGAQPDSRAGAVGGASGAARGAVLTRGQTLTMLRAALSRVGMPYVWGAAGPRAFDCSGLVQWSFARAGVPMPRVAADQARTGPAVPVPRLEPGDLLFYHTDPTAPGYISHVAIYLGRGEMIQAPEPGMDVEIVPVDLGAGFAGAVRVAPVVAARVAGVPVG